MLSQPRKRGSDSEYGLRSRRLLDDLGGMKGFKVSVFHVIREQEEADCILAEQNSLKCATLVTGGKGLSQKEEFLFGGISGKIVRTARNHDPGRGMNSCVYSKNPFTEYSLTYRLIVLQSILKLYTAPPCGYLIRGIL